MNPQVSKTQTPNHSNNDLTTIYKIYFPYSCCELVVPTLNDIKSLLLDNNEEMLDMLLQGKIKILTEDVTINSKKYQTALHNRQVEEVE